LASSSKNATKLAVSICEFAAVHPDGTHSIVRGGIDNFTAIGLPFNLLVWVFIEVREDALKSGKNSFEISLLNVRKDVKAHASGQFVVVRPDLASRFAVPIQLSLEAFGNYSFQVKIEKLSIVKNVKLNRPS